MQLHVVTFLPNFETRKVKKNALVDHPAVTQSEISIRINPSATSRYNHGQKS